jgi:PAS domain S-box-containing protein
MLRGSTPAGVTTQEQMAVSKDPLVGAGTGSALDAERGEEYVAALAAREKAEYALRASESRYRQALLGAQAALSKAQALYRVSSSLVAGEPMEALLHRLVDTVADALPADRVSLYAIDREGLSVSEVFISSEPSYSSGIDYSELMEGLAGWVLREKQATLSPGGVRDERESDRVHERRVANGHGPKVVAPIIYRERPLGVMVASNKPGGREFDAADAELLAALANQAAVSIEDAQIREELQASHAELEARVMQRTAALAESEERFRRITASVTDYVFRVEVRHGTAVSTRHGEGCVAVTGYSPDEFERDSGLWLEMVVPDDRALVLEQAHDVESGRRMRAIEHRLIKKDGSLRWVRSTPVPQYAADGSLVGYDGLIQDVTELRALQEQLAHAQRLQGIGRLAGGVAHDFNNLLTAILGNAELAMLDLEADHPARASIKEIVDAAEGAARLTRQLLSFARRQMIELVPLNLSDVVRNSLVVLRRLLGEDIDVIPALDERLWTVEADQGQIEQVLVNLTVNAREAMPAGGRLVIETANEVVAESNFNERLGLTPGRYATLCVTDTGTGMTEEVQSHLFEPFFTTKPQGSGSGTGLGLATCHGIVKNLGGHILVHSELGRGTTISIFLPESTRALAGPSEAAPAVSARGTETVLVVEDEGSVRRLAILGLRSHGYTVLEAANAAEALRVAATEHEIALVISDVIMPGMRGPELAARLRALRPDARVLLTSGHTDVPDAFRDEQGRLIPFLQKPFTPERLARKVRAVLDEH